MVAKKNVQSKKDKVLGKNKKPPYALIGFIVVIIVAVGVVVGLNSGGGSNSPAGGQVANVGTPTTNSSQSIEMTDLKADVANGKITINTEDVKKNRIVRFEDPNATLELKSGDKVPMPMVAFVSDKGNIKVAIADCEPCSSTRFHIEGNNLVCNACGTTWTLDDLQGISGGCQQYAPDQKAYTIQGDKLVIDEGPVKAWKPRV